MKALSQKHGRKARGQGMTEYIIIVALIAISAIGVVSVFGDNIRKIFGASVNALANNATANTNAKKAGESSTRKNITNFASQSTSEGS